MVQQPAVTLRAVLRHLFKQAHATAGGLFGNQYIGEAHRSACDEGTALQ